MGSLEKKSVMWRNFTFLYMTDVEKSEIYPVFLQICCFVTKSLLSQLMHFCAEKHWAKIVYVEKQAKYQV